MHAYPTPAQALSTPAQTLCTPAQALYARLPKPYARLPNPMHACRNPTHSYLGCARHSTSSVSAQQISLRYQGSVYVIKGP